MLSSNRQRLLLAAVVGAILASACAPAHAAEVTVTSETDAVDGQTTSPAALLASPGPDGISLREAILATNNAQGPHDISLSPVLAGQTIELDDSLPPLSRDYVRLSGVNDVDGDPAVTLDASEVNDVWALRVKASHVAIWRLRVTGVAQSRALGVVPGASPHGVAPDLIRYIVIAGNILDNTGVTEPAAGLELATHEPGDGAQLKGVTVIGNTFTGYSDQTVGVGTSGPNGLVEDITFYGNTFTDTELPIEANLYFSSDSTLRRLKVIRNAFIDNPMGQVILLVMGEDAPASNNTIEDTLVEGNLFKPGSGGVGVGSAFINATNSTVRNTLVVNNAFDGMTGIGMAGNATQGNTLDGLELVNNTFNASGISIGTGFGGVSGVEVWNSIFHNGSIAGASDVHHSIICQAPFAGTNSNFCEDPLFADGEFRLQPESPAIDAGTAEGAPATDRDCRARDGTPDIGAHEFGAPPAACPEPDVAPPDTSVDGGPAALSNDSTPSFSFSSSESSSTFGCRLDDAANALCTTPETPGSVADGTHTFFVWAIDESGNADTTPATHQFTVDTIAPETTITGGPNGVTNDPTPTFSFASNEAGSNFACRVDGLPFSRCSSPHTVGALADGQHTFSVRATDLAGNIDPTPASRMFTVDTAGPPPPLPPPPTPPNGDQPISNQFSFGKLIRNLRRGTAMLPVTVPGAGKVILRQTKQVRGATRQVRNAAARALLAQSRTVVRLPVRPRRKTKRQLSNRRCQKSGKKRLAVRVRTRVTYRPTGGAPRTQVRRVRLVKLC